MRTAGCAAALTLDHVVPVARGGTSTKGNVAGVRKACNAEKKYLTPAERILAELERTADGEEVTP